MTQKKLLLQILIIFGFLTFSPTQTYALDPSVCTNGGYCHENIFTTCNSGQEMQDSACAINFPGLTDGIACCYPESQVTPPPGNTAAGCGTPTMENGVERCMNGSAVISPSWTCERNSTVCCTTHSQCDNVFPIENIIDGPSREFFDNLNPLLQNGTPGVSEQLATPGGIVSRILQFLFPIAGLVLFVMLIWGGFEILMKSSQGTKALEAGKNRITAAIVGFLLLFSTYWMAQIIEAVFGIVIV